MMTSRNFTAPRRRRFGFTLTELLVVIGIIVALAAIGLPVVLRSYKQASKTRMQADLQTISTALNAYRQDFGDYPRVLDRDGAVNGRGWNIGAAILCKALIGPYGTGVSPNDPPTLASLSNVDVGQVVSNSGGYVALFADPGPVPGDGTKWAAFDPHDGADGPGFRIRSGQGRVWGPYLQPEKFNVNGCMLRDGDGNPILYLPAGRNANVRTPNGFVAVAGQPLYDARDAVAHFRRPDESNNTNALRAMQVMLGDTDHNGRIDQGETPGTEAPFLLWTAGPDGLFGPVRPDGGTWTPTKRDIERCDDITNFN